MASASFSAAVRGATVRVARPRKLTIGEFKIDGRPLGRGGTATVYRVSGPDGRPFAVKELAPQFLGDREAVARFRREFEIARELAHPGIVRTHELLEANGTLNIRMELVDGVSLKAVVARQKRLDPPLACWIATEAARTLAYAHARQIIHRDVKPDNLLVDRAGHLLVSDFGTARLVNLAMTRAGTLLGTPAYMAPELLAGKRDSVATPASDVYSLGAVLYELIEGRSPFAGGHRGEILPLLYAKSFQAPRPMSHAGDPALTALIASCLAREPGARPPDMETLQAKLTPFAGSSCRPALAALVEQARPTKRPRNRERAAEPVASGPVSLPSLAPRVPTRITIQDGRFALGLFVLVAFLIAWLVSWAPDLSSSPDPGRRVTRPPVRIPFHR